MPRESILKEELQFECQPFSISFCELFNLPSCFVLEKGETPTDRGDLELALQGFNDVHIILAAIIFVETTEQ